MRCHFCQGHERTFLFDLFVARVNQYMLDIACNHDFIATQWAAQLGAQDLQ